MQPISRSSSSTTSSSPSSSPKAEGTRQQLLNPALKAVGSYEKSSGSTPREDSSSSGTDRSGNFSFFMLRPDSEYHNTGNPLRDNLGCKRGYFVIRATKISGVGAIEKTALPLFKVQEPECIKDVLFEPTHCIKCEGPAGLLVTDTRGAIARINLLDKSMLPNEAINESKYLDFFNVQTFSPKGNYIPRPPHEYWENLHPLKKWLFKSDEDAREEKSLKESIHKLTGEIKDLQKKRDRLAKSPTSDDRNSALKSLREEALQLDEKKKKLLESQAFLEESLAKINSLIGSSGQEIVTLQEKIKQVQDASPEENSREWLNLIATEISQKHTEYLFAEKILKKTQNAEKKLKDNDNDYYSDKDPSEYFVKAKQKLASSYDEWKAALNERELALQDSATENSRKLCKYLDAQLVEKARIVEGLPQRRKHLIRFLETFKALCIEIDVRKALLLKKEAVVQSGSLIMSQDELLSRQDKLIAEKKAVLQDKERRVKEIESEFKVRQTITDYFRKKPEQKIQLEKGGSFIVSAERMTRKDIDNPLTRLVGVTDKNFYLYMKIVEPQFLNGVAILRSDWIQCAKDSCPLVETLYYRTLKELDPSQKIPEGVGYRL